MGVVALGASNPKMVALLGRLLIKKPGDRIAPSVSFFIALLDALRPAFGIKLKSTLLRCPRLPPSHRAVQSVISQPFISESALDWAMEHEASKAGMATSPISPLPKRAAATASVHPEVAPPSGDGGGALSPPPQSVPASYWELDAQLRLKGRILVGWHRVGRPRHCVNPRFKERALQWRAGDVLLVAIDPDVVGGSLKKRVSTFLDHAKF